MNNSNLNIQKAEISDVSSLQEMGIAMALETEGISLDPNVIQPGVEYVIHHPNAGFYLIARNGNEIAGSLMVTPEWSDWRNTWIWWIQSVYVYPRFRKMGVYRQLHATVLEMAKEERVPILRLYVIQENTKAQTTYQSCGMQASAYQLWEQEVSLNSEAPDGLPLVP
jgi:GNAT superfamily N-acetyltransferase